MKAYPLLAPEQKQEIMGRIKEKEERVTDLAIELNINKKRIHTALKCLPTVFAQRLAFQKLVKKHEFNDSLLIRQEIANTQSV